MFKKKQALIVLSGIFLMIVGFMLSSAVAVNIWFMPNENKGSFQLKTLRTEELRAPQVPGTHNLNIYSPVMHGTVSGTYTDSGTVTLSNKTLSSPVISGTVTGTYTDNGTSTMSNKTLTSPTITNPTITGSMTATGLIGTDQIADETREWASLDLCAAYVDGSGPISTSTTPALDSTARDNIAAIIYDGSGETTGFSFTKRVPTNYKTGGQGGIVIYVTVSSGTRSSNRTFSDLALDWLVWLNRDGVAFASSEYGQTSVTCGASSEMDRSNEVLTMYASSALINAIQVGDWLTFEFMNASTSSLSGYEDDLEIKGISIHGVFTR